MCTMKPVKFKKILELSDRYKKVTDGMKYVSLGNIEHFFKYVVTL